MINLDQIYASRVSAEQISELSSTIFNSAFSLGSFIGQITAGQLVATAGSFERAASSSGSVMIVYTLFYIAFIRKVDSQAVKETN